MKKAKRRKNKKIITKQKRCLGLFLFLIATIPAITQFVYSLYVEAESNCSSELILNLTEKGTKYTEAQKELFASIRADTPELNEIAKENNDTTMSSDKWKSYNQRIYVIDHEHDVTEKIRGCNELNEDKRVWGVLTFALLRFVPFISWLVRQRSDVVM